MSHEMFIVLFAVGFNLLLAGLIQPHYRSQIRMSLVATKTMIQCNRDLDEGCDPSWRVLACEAYLDAPYYKHYFNMLSTDFLSPSVQIKMGERVGVFQ